jgi:hypothetical protein
MLPAVRFHPLLLERGDSMDPMTIGIQLWLVFSAVLMWGLWGPWRG